SELWKSGIAAAVCCSAWFAALCAKRPVRATLWPPPALPIDQGTDLLHPARPQPLPDHIDHFFQLANASRGGPMYAPESPVVREAHQEPSRHGRARHRELSPTRERREPLGEAFLEYGRAPGLRSRQAGRIERRMRQHAQSQRKELGKVLPQTNDGRAQVSERVIGRV